MKKEAYSINLKALKEGLSHREFTVDTNFFSSFEGSTIHKGDFVIRLEIDKKPKVINLDFVFEGKFRTDCDRCLEEIDLPLNGKAGFLLKYNAEQGEDDNVIFITREQQEFEFLRLIFEMIHLAVPIRKVRPECDEAPATCDNSILEYLSKEEETSDEKSEEKGTLWEQMQKLKGL